MKDKRLRNFGICIKLGICLGISVLFCNSGRMPDQAKTVKAADYTDVFYIGVSDGKVNVRVAPGQDNAQVEYAGEKVQLKAGDRVIIFGEEMVGDKVWYHIRFTRGEADDEIVGYCTSSYVTKTTEQVFPTPTPTPEPTPTPTSTPTPTLVPEPTGSEQDAEPTAAPDKEEEKSGGNAGIWFAVAVIVVAGGGLAYFRYRQSVAAKSTANRKLAKIKNMKLENESDIDEDNKGKRKPEIKQKSNYREMQSEQHYQGVYVKNQDSTSENDLFEGEDTEDVKENAAREKEERRILREEIENLRQHDLVIHKYFGKGEVFDNSDVRLIEVRFGGDVRFMNKDALAAKKLMKKCSEDTMRYHRRSSEHQTDYSDF